MNMSSHSQRGAVHTSTLVIIGLSVFAVAFAGLAVWAFVNYMDQKNNVDSKIEKAVATAKYELGRELEKNFRDEEKKPLKSFAGPSDYGSLGFKYPKIWSVYVSNDGNRGTGYEAFFNPGSVPSVGNKNSRYALRVAIVNESYENTIEDYSNLVEKGDLKATPSKAAGQTGTRLDGNFSKDLRGAAVIYKIRDKSVIVQTDAETFKPDFEELIKTISFVE
ncbi:MAG: hypothetical protein WBK76_01570 [Candidatus Saccharimonadales bacterium]